MKRVLTAARYDVMLQARQGFYAASVFLVVAVGGLLLQLPPALRANHGLWVPALIVVNLPITTLFFVAGLILLERDQGTLSALGVTPISAGEYLVARMLTLGALALAETLIVAVMVFGITSWGPVVGGAALLAVLYTACGAGLSARYTSVNELIMPASAVVTFLLLPLLPHFSIAPRALFLAHPVEPALTLVRGGFVPLAGVEWMFAVGGSLFWNAVAWRWGRASVAGAMRETQATGGR